MKVIVYRLAAVVFMLLVSACSSADLNKILQDASSGQLPLTQQEVTSGLKEALVKGISNGSDQASQMDGFFKNELIKILLPEDARKAESTLRQLGLGGEVDRALLAINRGAEKAALEAKPIFVNAIRQMTIQDAFGILRGGDTAATDYLNKATRTELTTKFSPHIQQSLQEVGATKYYSDLAKAYNAIPLTNRKIDPDLQAYVTQKAIDGLFMLVAEEERKIRKDPLERTSALMKKVFAAQD